MGLVDRAEVPDNRRQIVLTLTAAGRDLVDTVMRARRDAIRPLLAAMPRQRRSELVALLGEFTAAAGNPDERDLWAMGWTD
jgi:DNA-binding MarR family transcriptional regulator